MLENETKIPFFVGQSNKTNLDKSVCLVYKSLNGLVIIAHNILYDLYFLLAREIDYPQHTQNKIRHFSTRFTPLTSS